MVALKAHEVERFMRSPAADMRMFLVYGSDSGAITERARTLEQMALKRGRGESVLRVGSDEIAAEPGRISDEANSSSLFGGEPVIGLRVLDGRHNVIGALQPLFDRPPEAAWLIVEAGDLNTTNPVRKAFEKAGSAVALPTFALSEKALSAFIESTVEDAGMTIDNAALELLEENLGGDRLAVRGELEKLILYAGAEKTIAAADVRAIVGDTTSSENDSLIDAALTGESEALEAGLVRLSAEAGSFVSVASAALRYLMQLQSLRASVDSGGGVSAVLDSARPPIFRQRRTAVETTLRLWSSNGLIEARRLIDATIQLTRHQPAIEDSAVSDALHKLALTARRLKRSSAA